ncbi:MAG TPA: hypothetical protein VEA99_11040 [Gemmatimonadaceae bacterium]|nr:hypothetical protein [Gemmatimonadaceae bacterium]
MPIPTERVVEEYPELRLRLRFSDGRLDGWEHRLSATEQATEAHVLEFSRQELGAFVRALEFLHGRTPSLLATPMAERLDPPRGTYIVITPHRVTLRATARRFYPVVRLPERGARFEDPRLPTWLRLAIEAREAPDLAATLSYAMILEDMRDLAKPSRDSLEEEIARTRDLLLHPEVTRGPTVSFAMRVIGARRFDRDNPDHLDFVARMRFEAERLVEAKLRERLR